MFPEYTERPDTHKVVAVREWIYHTIPCVAGDRKEGGWMIPAYWVIAALSIYGELLNGTYFNRRGVGKLKEKDTPQRIFRLSL